MLLRTAVPLYMSFQPILLGKLACCLSALIRIRRGQTDSESSAVNLEGQTALFIIVDLPAQIGMLCCILCQPLFERSIVCLEFQRFCWIRQNRCRSFSAVWSIRFSCCLHFCLFCKTGAFSRFFVSSTPAKQVDF